MDEKRPAEASLGSLLRLGFMAGVATVLLVLLDC